MPELPEVETVRRGLAPVLAGRRLAQVVARRPDLRFPLPPKFAARLHDRRVAGLDRRGKYLLIHLDDGMTWIAHLGMSGRFRVFDHGPPPPERHDHLLIVTDADVAIRFHDPRRFGFCDLWPMTDLDRHPMLAILGPDPLGEDFTSATLSARLAGRRGPLKPAIMDQRVIAGMGNIYASESLFRAGLSPWRTAQTVVGRRATRLVRAVREVFDAAITAGGASLRDHRRPDGEIGLFQHGFAVYGRAGGPCPGCACDPQRTGGIHHFVQTGRSTFYCPRRQR